MIHELSMVSHTCLLLEKHSDVCNAHYWLSSGSVNFSREQSSDTSENVVRKLSHLAASQSHSSGISSDAAAAGRCEPMNQKLFAVSWHHVSIPLTVNGSEDEKEGEVLSAPGI